MELKKSASNYVISANFGDVPVLGKSHCSAGNLKNNRSRFSILLWYNLVDEGEMEHYRRNFNMIAIFRALSWWR